MQLNIQNTAKYNNQSLLPARPSDEGIMGQYHGEEEGIWENISTDRRVSAEGSTEHQGGAAPEVRGRSRRANEAGGEIFCLYARL